MDLSEAIRELREQHAKLVAAIEQLESLAGSSNGNSPVLRSRRGRKSMGAAERREVSERMKKYWASRREAKGYGVKLVPQQYLNHRAVVRGLGAVTGAAAGGD